MRVLIAAIFSGIVLMMWGFAFWTASPVPQQFLKSLPDAANVVAAIRDSGAESGVYVYPGSEGMDSSDQAALEAWQERHREGPIAHIFLQSEGTEPMAPSVFLMGYLHFAVSALVAATLLAVVVDKLPSYLARVAFVAGCGLFAAVVLGLSDPIWYYHPWGYHLMQASFVVIGWVLAGLVIGAIVRPAKAATA